MKKKMISMMALVCSGLALNAATIGSDELLAAGSTGIIIEANLDYTEGGGDGIQLVSLSNGGVNGSDGICLDYMNNGEWADYSLTVSDAGTYGITTVYNAGSVADRQVELQVNDGVGGVFQQKALWSMNDGDMIDTGSWNGGPSHDSTIKLVDLDAGVYTMRLIQPTAFGIQLDAVRVSSFAAAAVPEPSALSLIMISLAGFVLLKRRVS